MDINTGWIKIHRTITEHWIFSDAEKFRAWITILSMVNHAEKQVNISNTLFTVNRGESLLSLESWAKLFGRNWNKSKVRRFFKLLESDSMVVTKSEHKTTRLTVCNYDTYQGDRNADETQMKRKRNADETQMTPNKNDKNDKNVNKEYIYGKFYDSEIEKSKNQKYNQFVKYLHGENMLKQKLSGVLSIKNQLTGEQFEKILTKCEANKLKMGDILTKIENDKKYYKDKTNLYRTLLNWADGRYIK